MLLKIECLAINFNAWVRVVPYKGFPMQDFQRVFERLKKSSFRSRFALGEKDRAYFQAKGKDAIAEHASRFIHERLAPERPRNDGRQTPWGGHPVFVAQHATGTCCRSCLFKWHDMKPNQPLSEVQMAYIVALLLAWIERQPGISTG